MPLDAPIAPDAIPAAVAAVGRSREVRESVRRKFEADRDRRLDATLDELARVMEPLRAYLVHTPAIGKDPKDPVRLASERVKAERHRVYRMRNRKSGGPRPAPQGSGMTSASFEGTIREAKGQGNNLTIDVDAFEKAAVGQARYPPDVFRRREEGRMFLERTVKVRDRVLRAGAQAMWAKPPIRPRSLYDESVAVRSQLNELARRARRHAKVKALPSPDPRRKWRRWDHEDTYEALKKFWKVHGRMPLARELAGDWALPSYGTVHRRFGGLQGLDFELDRAD